MTVVDGPVRGILGPCSSSEHGDELADRIQRHPPPEHVCAAAQSGAQFVQLHVPHVHLVEPVRGQGMTVRTSVGQPAGARAFAVAEDPHGSRTSAPFGQCVSTSPTRCDGVLSR